MNRSELNKFMQRAISEQGSASSVALARLAIGLQGYIPRVIDVSSTPSGKESSGDTIHEVLNSQNEIDALIDAAHEEKFLTVYVRIKEKDRPCFVICQPSTVNIQDDYIGCELDTEFGMMSLMLNKGEKSYLYIAAKTN